jgi:hypothetical protein
VNYLLNSTEIDILFATHSSRVDQINRSAWILLPSPKRQPSLHLARFQRIVVRAAGVVVISASLLLSGGGALASQPQVGMTECDHYGCTVLTRDNFTRAGRSQQASTSPVKRAPVSELDPRFLR